MSYFWVEMGSCVCFFHSLSLENQIKEREIKMLKKGSEPVLFTKCGEIAFEAFGYKIRVADANQIS